MIKILTNSGEVAYGVQRLLLDTPTDFAYIGNNYETGTTAFIISTSQNFMLNSEKQWVEIFLNSGNSGGGGEAPDPNALYRYDGGVET